MSKLLPISVCMITLNEEDRLIKTLPALGIFSSIIVFDSGSTDNTVRLCEDAGAIVHNIDWEGFGITRQKLFATSEQPWILWLDADEVITKELSLELQDLFNSTPKHGAYKINRMVCFMGKWIKHGDWFPDWNIRLFKNDVWQMDDSAVHESLKITGSTGSLSGLLEHYSFRDWDDYLQRCERYSKLWAIQKRKDGKTANSADPLLHAIWSFFKGYCLKCGFMDGSAGFRIAKGNAKAVYQKYHLLANQVF